MLFYILVDLILVYVLVKCQVLDIIGKNSMLYDPVNNLPFPCDSEAKPKKKNYIETTPGRFLYELPMKINRKIRTLYKRGDGDMIPIKLQPCPFPNGTQEHRWLKTLRKRTILGVKGKEALKHFRKNKFLQQP